MIASDYVIIPLVPDLFSLQGLANVGRFLHNWRKDWKNSLQRAEAKSTDYPSGDMQPIGYIILQHRERQSRLVVSHQRWADKIPTTYAKHLMMQANGHHDPDNDPNPIATVRNHHSLMALSHEARKPVFELKPADGAIGSHNRVVVEAEGTYYDLSDVIANRIGLKFED